MATTRSRLALALALAAGCASSGPGAGSPGRSPVAGAEGPGMPAGGDVLRSAEAPPRGPPRRGAGLPRRRAPAAPADLAALHGPCPGQGCPEGMQCVRYCGIAGCRPGSVFRSCEIPCKADAQCPPGLTCGQVSDGPGQVCLGGEGPLRPVPPDAELE